MRIFHRNVARLSFCRKHSFLFSLVEPFAYDNSPDSTPPSSRQIWGNFLISPKIAGQGEKSNHGILMFHLSYLLLVDVTNSWGYWVNPGPYPQLFVTSTRRPFAVSEISWVPRTRTTLSSFAVAGPRVWNSLPTAIRQITSYGQFRQHL